jgi:hypothetical protein
MAHNSLIRASEAAWSANSAVLGAEFWALDLGVFESINGDQGGLWAPAAAIEIGGAGINLQGDNHVVEGTLTFDETESGAAVWENTATATWNSGASASFEDGSTLTVAGTAYIAEDGKLTVQNLGKIDIESGGRLDWSTGAHGHVQNGATLHIISGGHVEFNNGSTMDMSGTLTINNSLVVADEATATVQTGGAISIEADGKIDVQEDGDINILSGGRLFVADGADLDVDGEINIRDGGYLRLENGARQNVVSGAYIWCQGSGRIVSSYSTLLDQTSQEVTVATHGQTLFVPDVTTASVTTLSTAGAIPGDKFFIVSLQTTTNRMTITDGTYSMGISAGGTDDTRGGMAVFDGTNWRMIPGNVFT